VIGLFVKPIATDQNRALLNLVETPESRRAGAGFPENRIVAFSWNPKPIDYFLDFDMA
jgi:hypothetical protein